MPSAPNASAMARVVITAPTAIPFPAALATVTMSGTTPCCSNAHWWMPEARIPVWTSSAMHRPPAARTAA